MKIKVHEASKKPVMKSPTLTPEEISAIETACSKNGMKCKVSTDSTFVVIMHNGEEVYIKPLDEYGEGLSITIGMWVYGGMDKHSWTTPDIKVNAHYMDSPSNDVSKIISDIIDNVYGLLEARESTRDYMRNISGY